MALETVALRWARECSLYLYLAFRLNYRYIYKPLVHVIRHFVNIERCFVLSGERKFKVTVFSAMQKLSCSLLKKFFVLFQKTRMFNVKLLEENFPLNKASLSPLEMQIRFSSYQDALVSYMEFSHRIRSFW